MAATILKFLELVDENTIVMSQGGTANYGSVSEIETENFKSLSYTDKCIHVSNHPQSKKWHCQQWPLALVNYALQHPDRTLLIIHSDPGFQIAPPAAAKAFSNLFHALICCLCSFLIQVSDLQDKQKRTDIFLFFTYREAHCFAHGNQNY